MDWTQLIAMLGVFVTTLGVTTWYNIAGFSRLDNRLNDLDNRLSSRLGGVEKDLGEVKEDIAVIKTELTWIKGYMAKEQEA